MNITELNQQIDQLKENLQFSNDVRRVIEDQKADQLSIIYHQYFDEVLEEGDTIKVSRNNLEFTRPQEGYNYNKELLTLYFKQKNWEDEEADRIQTSFYSTLDSSDFELRRMKLIGKVGEILLDSKDDILGAYNQVQSQFKDALDKQAKEFYDLKDQIVKLKSQIEEIKKQQLLDKLEGDGIKLIYKLDENTPSYRLPSIDLKSDYRINGVRSINILNKTKSGKSATLQVELVRRAWDDANKKYFWKPEVMVEKNVRMQNILGFLNAYSDKISAS